MSALIFVQHLNQLAGLVRGDVAVTILEVQNHRLSHFRVNGMGALAARPDKADRFSRFACVSEADASGVVAYRSQQLPAPCHRQIILYMVSNNLFVKAARAGNTQESSILD